MPYLACIQKSGKSRNSAHLWSQASHINGLVPIYIMTSYMLIHQSLGCVTSMYRSWYDGPSLTGVWYAYTSYLICWPPSVTRVCDTYTSFLICWSLSQCSRSRLCIFSYIFAPLLLEPGMPHHCTWYVAPPPSHWSQSHLYNVPDMLAPLLLDPGTPIHRTWNVSPSVTEDSHIYTSFLIY